MIHNNVLAVCTVIDSQSKTQIAQSICTRYFFAQLWCEFTKEVLTQFLSEDFKMKEQQQAKKSSARSGTKKPLVQSLHNGSITLTSEAHQILSEQVEMGALKTKASVAVSIEDQSRRNFYLKLFRIYNGISIDECLKSYTKIFNDVFVNEKPALTQKYYLCEVQIVEMNENQNFLRQVKAPIRFNFSQGTSKYLKYSASESFN